MAWGGRRVGHDGLFDEGGYIVQILLIHRVWVSKRQSSIPKRYETKRVLKLNNFLSTQSELHSEPGGAPGLKRKAALNAKNICHLVNTVIQSIWGLPECTWCLLSAPVGFKLLILTELMPCPTSGDQASDPGTVNGSLYHLETNY